MFSNELRNRTTVKLNSANSPSAVALSTPVEVIYYCYFGWLWSACSQWLWVPGGESEVVTKVGDQPLTGLFKREHEELLVLLSNTILNLAHPNHMREALLSRRVGIAGK